MSRPLYWLLVSDKDKPPGRKLYREPTVWAYFIGSSFWGFLCLTILLSVQIGGDPYSGFSAVARAIVMVATLPLPTVALTLRELTKSHEPLRRAFLQMSTVLGFIISFFFGLALWLVLKSLGVHNLLGIPVT